jgi:hypothetical protein
MMLPKRQLAQCRVLLRLQGRARSTLRNRYLERSRNDCVRVRPARPAVFVGGSRGLAGSSVLCTPLCGLCVLGNFFNTSFDRIGGLGPMNGPSEYPTTNRLNPRISPPAHWSKLNGGSGCEKK